MAQFVRLAECWVVLGLLLFAMEVPETVGTLHALVAA